ncbi:unnamed protein product [Paramecium sonneborni]|uniref:Ubiquitinyl hydrolase 1 n=1 Tax=Paramecium sonneborni TaxID=65129 RepID=A0A8S1NFF1_9CILI|nr:unnamed protein product [Paramecium sonneborni]
MFICCKTKIKKSKQAINKDSEVRQFSKKNEEQQVKEEKQDQDSYQEQKLKEQNKSEESNQEINNLVNQIKAYREQGQFKESIDVEKEYVNGLLSEDLPIIYFIEYRWALHYTGFLQGKKKVIPKEINNNKILIDEHKINDTINIIIDNDPQLLPGIQPEKHYSLLNERAWKFIHTLYGGGPTITIDLDNVKMQIHQNRIQERQHQVIEDKQQLIVQSLEQINNEPNYVLPMPIGSQIDLNNDAATATHITTTTAILPLKISTDSHINFKYSSKNIDDFDKTTPSYLTDKNSTVQTNIQKIYMTIPVELPIVGFYNPKYYCYMNAALQCLLSISKFNQKILKIQKLENRQCTKAYQSLIKLIQVTIPGSSITTDLLMYICQNKFKVTQQQDSHEFLLLLLSQIQEELVGKKNTGKKEFFHSAIEAWEFYKGKNADVITELFVGQVSNKNYCLKCKRISEVYDPILDINLPLQNYSGAEEIKLNECLYSYFKEEQIQDEWICNICQHQNKYLIRKILVTQKPQFLIIHLKRFTQFPRNQKIQNDISYPEVLNIQQFCDENIIKAQYRLKGLISHQGQLNSGHYKAYAKRQNEWYEFDDDIVTKDKKDRHLSDKGAYIIFYEEI